MCITYRRWLTVHWFIQALLIQKIIQQRKEIIYYAVTYLCDEKDRCDFLLPPDKVVAQKATNGSEKTVERICSENI